MAAAPEAAASAPAGGHGGDQQRHEPSKSNRKRRPSEGEGSNDNPDDDEPQPKRGAYQCRFCKLSFEKSQALGGHMNRHRSEREKESLVQAHQLVQEHLTGGSAHRHVPAVQGYALGALSATEIAQSPSGPSRISSQFQGLSARQYPVSPASGYGPRMSSGYSTMSVMSPPPPLVNFNTMNMSSNSSSTNLQQSPVNAQANWNQDNVSMHSIASRALGNERPANSFHNQGVTNETINQMQHLPQDNYFHGHYEPFP